MPAEEYAHKQSYSLERLPSWARRIERESRSLQRKRQPSTVLDPRYSVAQVSRQ